MPNGSPEYADSAETRGFAGQTDPPKRSPGLLLSGITVVDASRGVAGNFCGRLFADHGAVVTLVEPPGGSPLRQEPPFGRAGSGHRSLLFDHLNLGKRGVCADDRGERSWISLATALAADSRVAITDDRLLADALSRHCATCLVTDFSAVGPWAAWRADELIHQALGGSMLLTGLPGRPPLYGIGNRAAYGAGVAAYVTCIASLLGGVGAGALLEVSIHQVTASMAQNVTTQFEYSGVIESRGEGRRTRGVLQTADGWVVLFVLPGAWQRLCAALAAPELGTDPRFAHYPDLITRWTEARDALAQVVRTWTSRTLVRASSEAGAPARQVLTPSGLLDDPDLRARHFWEQNDDGVLQLGPGFWYEGWARPRSRAPRLGEHNAAKTVERGPASRPAPPLTPSTQNEAILDGVLDGVRILDLTTAWAGPMATRILAALGASVVKIEGPRYPDGWRGQMEPTDWWMYPDGDPGRRPFDRNAWFNTQNAGKRSVVLDLKSEAGRRVVQDLARRSDLVIANSRSGTLRRFGLDRQTLAEIAPSVSVVEMLPYGSGGPSEHDRALGPTMEAAAGITHFIGYRGEGPLGSGSAYVDPMGALHGAAAALTALFHRRRTGGGIGVEVAQREAAMQWIGELLLEAATLRIDHVRLGNDHRCYAPHGAYACAGEDEWIAISIHSTAEWRILMEQVGRRDLARECVGGDARRRRREELDAVLSQWTSRHGKWELASRLQQAGVRAAPVSNGRDLARDADLRASQFYVRRRHAEAGTHEYPGVPLGGLRSQGPVRPSPCFGEHTREVLGEWLNMDDQQIDRLEAEGVIADMPLVDPQPSEGKSATPRRRGTGV